MAGPIQTSNVRAHHHRQLFCCFPIPGLTIALTIGKQLSDERLRRAGDEHSPKPRAAPIDALLEMRERQSRR